MIEHGMLERHYDYVLGPPRLTFDANWSGLSQLSTVAGGTQLIGLPLNLDPDAPFILRSMAVKCKFPVDNVNCTMTQPLDSLYIRFTGPIGDYLQQDFVPLNLFMAFFGQLGNPKPFYRQLWYPANGVIKIDLWNKGATTLNNVTFYFRGVKLFPFGRRQGYTYPQKAKISPYTIPVYAGTPIGQPALSLPVGPVVLKNNPIQNRQDWDVVIRSMQAGISETSGTVFEIFFLFKDEDLYPYSSHPIRADVLFGMASNESPETFACGGNQIKPFETGPGNPCLWFPEIYLPRQHHLFYDVYRDDSSFGCASAVNYPFTLSGSSVIRQ